MLSGFFIGEDFSFIKFTYSMDYSRKLNDFLKGGFSARDQGLVSPFEVVPIITFGENRKPVVVPMRWGIRSMNGYTVIYKDIHHAIANPKLRRCVVPVNWFFDDSKPWLYSSGETNSYLAGAYFTDRGLDTFIILTGSDGLPVMLRRGDVRDWIYPDIEVYRVLEKTMPITAMLLEEAV